MTPEEGVSLLLHGHDDHDIQQHVVAASEIVDQLGGLALAIDQAASYIKYKKMPLDRLGDFLTMFETQRKEILSYTPPNFWEYGTMQIHGREEQNKAISAFTTWEMSFQQLGADDERKATDIAHFLTLSAFLDPAKIGESLFRCHWEAGDRPEWMRVFNPVDEESDEGSSESGVSSHEDGEVQRRERWSSEQFWELIAKSYDLSLLQSIS